MKVKIKQYSFEISEPYQPGHVCSQAEAFALNLHRGDNLRNNLVRLLGLPDDGTIMSQGDLAEVEAQIREYDGQYKIGMRAQSIKRRQSRLDLMLRKVALERIEAQARRQGLGLSAQAMEEAIQVEIRTPGVQEEARERLKEEKLESQKLMTEIFGPGANPGLESDQ